MTRRADAFLRRFSVDVRKVQLELEAAAAKRESAFLASSLAIEERKRLGTIVARHCT